MNETPFNVVVNRIVKIDNHRKMTDELWCFILPRIETAIDKPEKEESRRTLQSASKKLALNMAVSR